MLEATSPAAPNSNSCSNGEPPDNKIAPSASNIAQETSLPHEPPPQVTSCNPSSIHNEPVPELPVSNVTHSAPTHSALPFQPSPYVSFSCTSYNVASHISGSGSPPSVH